MKENIVWLVFLILIGILMYHAGYQDALQKKGRVEISPTYSSTQINNLIKHSIILTNIIAEQLQYEKSITK